jgi:hypothetical protein
MPSKYQKNPFPKHELAKMKSVNVLDPFDQNIEISYQELKLTLSHGQLCWFYESSNGNLFGNLLIPIARMSNIKKLKDDE